MQELFWRGDTWFGSLSERSQIFLINNQDFVSAQLPKSSEFSCAVSKLADFPFPWINIGWVALSWNNVIIKSIFGAVTTW